MFCHSCGHALSDGQKFCGGCGASVLSAPAPVPVPVAPAPVQTPVTPVPVQTPVTPARPAKSKRVRAFLITFLSFAVFLAAITIILIQMGIITWFDLGGNTAYVSDEPDTRNRRADNVLGNVPENLENGGLFAVQGDWYYFANPSDGYTLYMLNLNTETSHKLTEFAVANINVLGDIVVFTDIKSSIIILADEVYNDITVTEEIVTTGWDDVTPDLLMEYAGEFGSVLLGGNIHIISGLSDIIKDAGTAAPEYTNIDEGMVYHNVTLSAGGIYARAMGDLPKMYIPLSTSGLDAPMGLVHIDLDTLEHTKITYGDEDILTHAEIPEYFIVETFGGNIAVIAKPGGETVSSFAGTLVIQRGEYVFFRDPDGFLYRYDIRKDLRTQISDLPIPNRTGMYGVRNTEFVIYITKPGEVPDMFEAKYNATTGTWTSKQVPYKKILGWWKKYFKAFDNLKNKEIIITSDPFEPIDDIDDEIVIDVIVCVDSEGKVTVIEPEKELDKEPEKEPEKQQNGGNGSKPPGPNETEQNGSKPPGTGESGENGSKEQNGGTGSLTNVSTLYDFGPVNTFILIDEIFHGVPYERGLLRDTMIPKEEHARFLTIRDRFYDDLVAEMQYDMGRTVAESVADAFLDAFNGTEVKITAFDDWEHGRLETANITVESNPISLQDVFTELETWVMFMDSDELDKIRAMSSEQEIMEYIFAKFGGFVRDAKRGKTTTTIKMVYKDGFWQSENEEDIVNVYLQDYSNMQSMIMDLFG